MSRNSLRAGAVAIVAAAGMASSAMAGLTVSPTDVLTWGGVGTGRSLAGVQPSGLTWAWTNSTPSNPVIDANGRVYFQGQYTQSPPVGTITAGNHRGIFTATNSTDIAVFNGLYDGGTYNGYGLRNSTGSVGGISTTTPRVSGSYVAMGTQLSGGTPALVESGTTANNTMYVSGTYAGGVNPTAQQLDSVTLNNSSGVPTAANFTTAMRNISQQNSQINSSGTTVLGGLSVPVSTGVFASTANATAAPFGNNAFIATKTAGGSYNVVAQGGQSAPGVPGGVFQNGGTNGLQRFNSRINRNGQVFFDAKLCTNFPVTANSDDTAYIYTPGAGSTLIWREGQGIRDAAGNIDAGGALFGNSSAFLGGGFSPSQRSFSNAGVAFVATSIGGDTIASGAGQNDSGLYVATTSNTIRVLRRDDPLASLGANVNLGAINTSSVNHNNAGVLAFGTSLQGSGVTAGVQPVFNVAGPLVQPVSVNTPGTQGNDTALMIGTPTGGFQAIARTGSPAPGTPYYFNLDTGGLNLSLNNAGSIIFSTGLTPYAAGQQIGVGSPTNPGPLSSILPGGPTTYFAWNQAYGLVPLFTLGVSQVEVETGLFKTIQQVSILSGDNGDGGSAGLNDSDVFVARITYTDNTWSVVKLAIPAPGTGAMALLGLGALARRRRA